MPRFAAKGGPVLRCRRTVGESAGQKRGTVFCRFCRVVDSKRKLARRLPLAREFANVIRLEMLPCSLLSH